jgi:hypothetical protein
LAINEAMGPRAVNVDYFGRLFIFLVVATLYVNNKRAATSGRPYKRYTHYDQT